MRVDSIIMLHYLK